MTRHNIDMHNIDLTRCACGNEGLCIHHAKLAKRLDFATRALHIARCVDDVYSERVREAERRYEAARDEFLRPAHWGDMERGK